MPHSRFHPSSRLGGENRPPAGPFCYCPMHCPVTWDAYEAMMQEWTKGAPPPGYWYPPPPPPLQPPPPVGLSEDQQDTTKGRGDASSSQKSSVLPVQPPSETPDEEEQDPSPCILPSELAQGPKTPRPISIK